MSNKRGSKLSIHVGEIQVEGDEISVAAGQYIVASFLGLLRDIRDDLISQGIETTVTIGGQPLDEDGAEESR